jgi:hypothetical protein
VSSEGDNRGETRARWPDAGEKQPLTSVSTRQQHIATMAKKYAGSPLTTLSHNLDQVWLREAYGRVRRDSAPGVDGQTVAGYGENLAANLTSLEARAKNGTYRAPPAKRVHHFLIKPVDLETTGVNEKRMLVVFNSAVRSGLSCGSDRCLAL